MHLVPLEDMGWGYVAPSPEELVCAGQQSPSVTAARRQDKLSLTYLLIALWPLPDFLLCKQDFHVVKETHRGSLTLMIPGILTSFGVKASCVQ